MIRGGIGILIFLFSLTVTAQMQSIDSLNMLLLKLHDNDSEELALRFALSEAFYHTNTDSALFHIEKGLQLVEDGAVHPEINDLDFLFFKLNIKHRSNQFEEANEIIDVIDQNIDRALNKPKMLVNNYRARASIAFGNDDFDLTIENLDKALEIAESTEDSELIWAIYTEYASIYSRQGDRVDLVAYYLIQASKYNQHDKPNLIINYINIGNLNYHYGKDSTALYYLNEVINLRKHSNVPFIPPTAAYLAGKIYMAERNWNEAVRYFRQSASLAKEAAQDQSYHLAMANLSKVLMEQSGDSISEEYVTAEASSNHYDDKDIEQSLLDAYGYFKKNNSTNHLATTSAFLAQYYFEKNKNKAAAFYEQAKSNTTLEAFTDRYYLDHVSLLEELIELYEDYQYGTRVKQDYLAYIENKNKSEQALRILEYKKGYEYEIEAQTNEMEVANLKREKQRLILFFSAIGCTLILGFSLFLLYLNLRRQRIKNDILSKRSLELINSNTKLKNKNKELERLAYITSHDLKTPLLSIVGFSKLILRELKKLSRPDLTEIANFINDSACQMEELIESVLEYSKLTETSRDQIIENVNLEEVVELVKVTLKSVAPESEKQIIYEGDPVVIRANKCAINSLFQNLIGNGLHYNESAVPTVRVVAVQNETDVTIRFIDNGIGIPTTRQEEIFTIFSRLHSNNQYSGTGIGLAIVQKIVDDLNGSISVTSAESQGSTFTIQLPTDATISQEVTAT